MSLLEIRLCKSNDLPEVVNLMKELSEVAHTNEDFMLENIQKVFEEMSKNPEFYYNLVAVSARRIVGFISVVFYKTVFHKGGTALINELIVTDSLRGKGLGRELLMKAKEEALLRGMDEIEVGTEKTNSPAQSFYKKYGFDEEFVLLGMEF